MKKRVFAFIVALLITASFPFVCFAQENESEHPTEYCKLEEDAEDKKDATCTDDGYVTVKCTVHTDCGNTFTKLSPKLGHNWSDWTPVEGKEPTCTEDGEEERTCQREGCDVKETRLIPKLGHTWDNGTIHEADCTHGAYTTYKCSVCNETKDVVSADAKALGHDWSDWVIVNPTNDKAGSATRTCKNCDEIETVEIKAQGHTFDAAKYTETPATCTAKGSRTYTCTAHENCGVSVTVDTDFAQHSYELKYDEKATCTKDGKIVMECSVCHKSKDIIIPKFGHTWDYGVVTTEPTHKATGVRTFTCSTCNETRTERIEKLPHNFAAGEEVLPTCKDGGKSGYIPYICSCGESYVKLTNKAISHSWSTWTVVQKATDDLYGIEKRTCSICNEEQFRMTNPIGDHNFVEDAKTKIAATCTEDGSVTMKCSAHTDCGKTFIKTLPKLGHDWSEWSFSEGKNPTCTDDGEEVRTCKRNGCGASETRVVKALQHDMRIIGSIEKTENVDGYTDYKCSRCEFSYRSIDHNFEWQEKVPATCMTEGSRQQICSVCKAEGKEEKIEKTDHNYKWTVTKKATCKATGVKKQICSVCKAEGKAEKIKKTVHDYKWTVTKKATCKATGIKKQICSVCRAEGKTKKIAKTTHAYKWIISKKATCKATGTRKQVCSVCKVVGKTEKIAKAKHSYKWTTTQKAVCNKNGSKNGTQKQICSVCKAAGKTRTIAPSHKWSKSGSQCTVCKKEDKFVKIKSIECTKTEFVVGEKWGDTKIIMTIEFENHTAKLVRTKAPKAFNTDKPTEESHPIKITFNYGGQTSKPIIIVVKAA